VLTALAAILLVAHCVAVAAPAEAQTSGSVAVGSQSVVDEIDKVVREHYYAPQRLEIVHWGAAVVRARQTVAASRDPARRTAAVAELLATLKTSHTAYYPREDPAYWQLLGIFEPYIGTACSEAVRPALPVTVNDIGVFWKQAGAKWFVGGVYAGGPAEAAGLRFGDEIVRASDLPFSPVTAFAGKVGLSVPIDLRRSRDGATLRFNVVPEATRPHEALRKATADSWRIIERGASRIAYLHVWSWTSLEIQQAVLQAIAQSNKESADAFVLDLRDGWGGASPEYLGIFSRDVPILYETDRDGKVSTYDAQIRKPAVILINGGTRSGKEIIAYGAKKHHLARLIGERTAGAVVGGQPFCLQDGSLLFLAVADASIDGERLEGVGVAPDIEVPFDVRYADGKDPQLERALDLLSSR